MSELDVTIFAKSGGHLSFHSPLSDELLHRCFKTQTFRIWWARRSDKSCRVRIADRFIARRTCQSPPKRMVRSELGNLSLFPVALNEPFPARRMPGSKGRGFFSVHPSGISTPKSPTRFNVSPNPVKRPVFEGTQGVWARFTPPDACRSASGCTPAPTRAPHNAPCSFHAPAADPGRDRSCTRR